MNAQSRAQTSETSWRAFAPKMLAAALLAVFLCSLLTATVSAEKVTTHLDNGTQNEFTKNCRDADGTPKRESKKVVSCTYNPSHKTTCNFNTKPAVCTNVKTYEPAGSGTDTGNLQVVDQTAAPADSVDSQEIESDPIIESDPAQVAESEIVGEPTEQAEPTPPTETTDSTMAPSDVESLPEFGQ